VIRLVPSPNGCAVRTAHGVLHLPGLRLEVVPARTRAAAGTLASGRATKAAPVTAAKGTPAGSVPAAVTGSPDG
jgi:hypothetical protein